jgi:MFS family permease
MFRGLPRAFWILCCGALINQLGGFVVPFQAIYLTTVRQVGVEAAGFTVALHGMGSFASSPLGGVLADRIGRRRTMLVALLSGAAAMAHLGLARAPAHIAFAAFILGLAGDLYRPAVSAAIADVVPRIAPDRSTSSRPRPAADRAGGMANGQDCASAPAVAPRLRTPASISASSVALTSSQE